MNDPKGRERLSTLIIAAFDGLKTYGKEPEQLTNANRLFQVVLSDYDIEKIEGAFRVYFKTASEMPAPADIVNIIERGGKPAFDKSVYLRLVKRQEADPYNWNALTPEEREYIKEYERFQVTGKF